MPKIVIVANCQGASMALVARALLPDDEVLVVDAFDHTTFRVAAWAALEKRLADADFILAQKGGYGPLALGALRAIYPKTTLGLAFPLFRGLHPDACYVGGVGDKMQEPSLNHSVAILEAFRAGRSARWAVEHALTIDNFERLGLLDAWGQSLDALTREDATLDFPIASLIDGFCRQQMGFWTFNHPTLALVQAYLRVVFRTLGLRQTPADFSTTPDPLAADDAMPVLDFVAAYNDLPYRTTQQWKLAPLGGRFLDLATIVHRFYAAYAACAAPSLRVAAPADLMEGLRADKTTSFLVPS
jgi:hypothetical protein